MLFPTILSVFSGFSFLHFENFQNNEEIPEYIFPIIQMSQKPDEKNIFILSEKFSTENPLENMKDLQNAEWDATVFECENFSVFVLPGDISLVENSWSEFFFSENMVTGDFYDCENKKLAKYNFIEFSDENISLEKIIFHDDFYNSEICEWKNGKFEKYFSWKNGEKNMWNPENCEKILEKYKELKND